MKKYIPLLIVIILGVGYVALRYHKLSEHYMSVLKLAKQSIEAGDDTAALMYIEYVEDSGFIRDEVQKLRTELDRKHEELQRISSEIEPYVEDGLYEDALALIDKRDNIDDSLRRNLRAIVYRQWGWIVFSANPEGSFDLYAARPDASLVFRLTNSVLEEMGHDVSADGKKIAYARLESKESMKRVIAYLDLETGHEQILPFTGHTNLDPAFSPDSGTLAFATSVASFSYINLYDFAKRETVRVARGSAANQPDFSPDGKRIIFEGIPVDSNVTRLQIVSVKTDGTDLKLLTDVNRGHARDPSYSYEEGRLVFRYNDDIYVLREGEEPTLVSDPAITERQPCFSQDGRYLAYIADVNGRAIIVRHDLKTGKRFFLPSMGRACQWPVWVRELSLPPGAEEVQPAD
ncbi:MAG: hypothetical protein U5N86_01435 [Planctomycetota bacterium]|nr:hypothetical protein [Planctomycetota bacterium]